MLKPLNCSRAHAINRHNNTKILIVDDNDSIRNAAESMISHWGYQTCVASNGNEAISKYQETKPDAVLMDIRMPEKDGFSAFYEIKQKFPDVKIFLMTAYQNDPRIKNGLKDGILFVFEKPFSLSNLKEKLKLHLGRGRSLR